MKLETHGVVTLSSLDLRVRPDHRAEMGSQLLMGEVVERLGRDRAGWVRVRSAVDGYAGWVRQWGLAPCGAIRARRWARLATVRVRIPIASIQAEPGSTTAVGPLFLGSHVIPGPSRAGFRAVELPDARRGWVAAAALESPRGPRISLVERIRTLLGVPYLWGGRTPAGLDCSGLVQLVLGEQGTALPRDAHDQWKACELLDSGASAREGDLAFFSTSPRARRTHVGIALGGMYFAHSRALVRIESLDSASPLFSEALSRQFRGWARPRATASIPLDMRISSRKRQESA